jgi:4-alpha-glucanotransferase
MGPQLNRRTSGLLLHPTSLPSGRIDGDARRFVDFLAASGQTLWQMLPIGPPGPGGSPYDSPSAFAGSPELIDPSVTVEVSDVARYRESEADWLEDFALYTVLKAVLGGDSWVSWPAALAARDPGALAKARDDHSRLISVVVEEQARFDRCWRELKRYAADQGVCLIGDLPIYVSHDSADVWANREIFQLDTEGAATHVAGVPPDYFSETGQRWGNPLYRWDVSSATGHAWWVKRFRRLYDLFDIVRIDHFRGFEAYWCIPAAEETAMNGDWVPGPGAELFRVVEGALGPISVIAEDLGLITEAVHELRLQLGYPGMRVLQFDLESPVSVNCVVYPGTHDNDTCVGWYQALAEAERLDADRRLGLLGSDPAWAMLEMAWRSPGVIAVAAVQDVLSLGGEARMNRPGLVEGNWGWRLEPGLLGDALAERLQRVTRIARRGRWARC